VLWCKEDILLCPNEIVQISALNLLFCFTLKCCNKLFIVLCGLGAKKTFYDAQMRLFKLVP
jgi:hypothetical protein